MNPDPNIEKDLFAEALELPPDQREGFLKGACRSDEQLRESIIARFEDHPNTSREELLFALFALPTSRELESTNPVGIRRRRVVPFSTTPEGAAATNILTGNGSEASLYVD